MEMPLYEYDQVITCEELSSVAAQLTLVYNSIPKWKCISRMKYRIMIQTVNEIHEALHLKEEMYKQSLKGEIQ